MHSAKKIEINFGWIWINYYSTTWTWIFPPKPILLNEYRPNKISNFVPEVRRLIDQLFEDFLINLNLSIFFILQNLVPFKWKIFVRWFMYVIFFFGRNHNFKSEEKINGIFVFFHTQKLLYFIYASWRSLYWFFKIK